MLHRAMQRLWRPIAGAAVVVASSRVAMCSSAPPCARAMVHGKDIAVTGEDGIDVCLATRSLPFLDWCENLPTDFTVASIHIQSLDLFGRPPRQRVGFVKFIAEVSAGGEQVPGIVFARGGAIAVLVLLQCEGKDYALMTRQARVPIGSSGFDEVPAGMLDGQGHFAGVAAKELKEETGLEIRDRDLTDMTHLAYSTIPLSRPLTVLRDGADTISQETGKGTVMGIYPSPGGCDEYIRMFLFRKRVTKDELAEMQAHIRGEKHESERIAVRVVPLEDVWKWTPDSKSHSAVLLYEQLVRSGKLTRV